ncbi:hypothetical protein EON65_27875 [archaeon]|nr:MAG: hypothetical protein EON65_27875 [archaeon]
MQLGGPNHSLASRASPETAAPPGTFQNPPASFGWVLDRPTMLMGIDVSHPWQRSRVLCCCGKQLM